MGKAQKSEKLLKFGIIGCLLYVVGDFLILDVWLPGKVRHMIKGAEHCRAWERKEWLLKLAVPEHCLSWTFLVCPIAGLIVAGIGMLIG